MNPDRAFIDRFKAYYRDLHDSDPSRLQALYAHGVVYRGPTRKLRGLVELEDYHAELIEHFEHCRFEFLDEIIGDNSAYLKWTMHAGDARGNPRQSLRGVSHLKWGDRIHFQEDFYDTDMLLREQLPLVGNVRRWLRPRLVG